MPSPRCRRRSDPIQGARRVRGALLLLAPIATLLGGCAAPFDVEPLERGHPALAELPSHRLADVTPYVLPWQGELLWFLCRWRNPGMLRVALPGEGEVSRRQRELAGRALSAWTSAGFDFRVVGESAEADIVVAVVPAEEGRAGHTGAECGVALRDGTLSAELVHAVIGMPSHQLDVLGREVPLSDAEWLGSLVHELGHALGFQGHARRGPGPMVREVEQVRRIGRDVLAHRDLQAPTLRALYAMPSGTVVARVPLAPGRTAIVDRLARIAPARGYRGPLVRVGDEAARIAWWREDGRSVGVRIPDIVGTLHDASKLDLQPDLLAQAWLGPDS